MALYSSHGFLTAYQVTESSTCRYSRTGRNWYKNRIYNQSRCLVIARKKTLLLGCWPSFYRERSNSVIYITPLCILHTTDGAGCSPCGFLFDFFWSRQQQRAAAVRQKNIYIIKNRVARCCVVYTAVRWHDKFPFCTSAAVRCDFGSVSDSRSRKQGQPRRELLHRIRSQVFPALLSKQQQAAATSQLSSTCRFAQV